MKNKNVFVVSVIIMIVGIVCLGINSFISPLTDSVIRVVGVIMIIDLSVLTYSSVKLKKHW